MINAMAIQHTTTLAKIFRAIWNVSKLGYSVDHVRNRNGDAYIAVRYRPGVIVGKPFQFLDKAGHDISATVYSVIC